MTVTVYILEESKEYAGSSRVDGSFAIDDVDTAVPVTASATDHV
jgi:hypothetical protein